MHQRNTKTSTRCPFYGFGSLCSLIMEFHSLIQRPWVYPSRWPPWEGPLTMYLKKKSLKYIFKYKGDYKGAIWRVEDVEGSCGAVVKGKPCSHNNGPNETRIFSHKVERFHSQRSLLFHMERSSKCFGHHIGGKHSMARTIAGQIVGQVGCSPWKV